MGVPSTSDPAALIARPEFYQDPYPTYAVLRDEAPVFWYPPWGQWLVSRYDDIAHVLRHPEAFSSVGWEQRVLGQLDPALLARITEIRDHYDTPALINSDPPEHVRLRRPVGRAFSPRNLEAMRPTVEELVGELLDGIGDATETDLIEAFAYPLPALVIAGLMGVPAADRHLFTEWSADVVAFTGSFFPADRAERAESSMREFRAYLRGLIRERRAAPGADLISQLLMVTDEAAALSDDEIVATAVVMLFAGHETTANLIGNGMLALFRNPVALERFRDDPDHAAAAIEELLRYDSPVHRTRRVAKHDVELGGQLIRAGQPISNLLGAGNRDPRHFAEPDTLDLDRVDSAHLSFGHGIHYCVGAALSRLEAPIAFNELLRRFPRIAPASDDPPRWKPNLAFHGLEALPVRLV
jgi:cytochrome P450